MASGGIRCDIRWRKRRTASQKKFMRKRKPTSSVAKTEKRGNFTYFHNELNFSNARSPAYPACIYLPKKIRQVAPQQEFLVFVRAGSVRSNFYVAFSSSRSTLTYCKMPFCAFQSTKSLLLVLEEIACHPMWLASWAP